MVDCDFLAKHDICIHPVLRRRTRRCPHANKAKIEEWRCFFRLLKEGKESDATEAD